MSFLYFIRRTHLYLGLVLLPWVIMFGVSSIPLNHNDPSAPPAWVTIADMPLNTDVPATNKAEDLRGVGRAMMNAAGVSGGFYVNRPNPGQLNVHHPKFVGSTRLFYYIDEKRLVAERQAFAPRMFIMGLHMRAGYTLGGFWDSLWAVFVDLVSVGLLLWIVSGLIMWWKIPGTGLRRWGWIALASGAACFAVIMLRL